MLFAAICMDKPDHVELRLKERAQHLAFLEALGEKVRLGGPFLDAGGRPIGSLLLLECADESAAKALLDANPYAKAGLFSSVELRPWRRSIGANV